MELYAYEPEPSVVAAGLLPELMESMNSDCRAYYGDFRALQS